MDTKTLIHVGVEVVVIGGVVFHFQRKINKLEGENQALRDENTKIKEEISKIFKILNMHDQILSGKIRPRDVYSGTPPQSSPPIYTQSTPSPPVYTPPPTHTPTPPEPEEIPEEEPDDEELDILLKEELSDLKAPASDFIEIECADDIIPKKSSKKKVLQLKKQANG